MSGYCSCVGQVRFYISNTGKCPKCGGILKSKMLARRKNITELNLRGVLAPRSLYGDKL
jgi:hypothetical protein